MRVRREGGRYCGTRRIFKSQYNEVCQCWKYQIVDDYIARDPTENDRWYQEYELEQDKDRIKAEKGKK